MASSVTTSLLPSQSREQSSPSLFHNSDIPDRVDSAFRDAVSQTPNSQLFKDAIFSDPIDLQEVRRCLSYTDAEKIEEIYTQILEEKILIPVAFRGQLLEILLRSGDISESGKKKIFNSSTSMYQMEDRFLVDLFTSFETPFECRALSLAIDDEASGKDLFNYSWKHNLSQTLFFLSENPFFSKYFGAVLPEIKSNITPEKIQLVLLVLPFCGEDSLAQLFHLFDSLSAQDFEAPHVSQFKQAFFFSDFIKSYFTTAEFQPTLSQLESGFNFFWENVDGTDEDQMRFLSDVAQTMYRHDSTYFDRFITPILDRELSTKDLGTPLVAILSCLGKEALSKVETQLKALHSRSPNSMLVKLFFKAGKRSSLLLWKYDYLESVRNLPMLVKGSQIDQDGTYPKDQIAAMFDALNRSAPASIWFNPAARKTSLTGGVCSAMTLRAIKSYRDARKTGLTPIESIQAIGSEFSLSNASFRGMQAVYNTIGRKKNDDGIFAPSDDFGKDKIEALIQLENPGARINLCTDEIDLLAPDSKEKITQLAADLPDGIYVCRSLSPLTTDIDKRTPEYVSKEERFGHSTCLIKEGNDSFYYDPALGFMQLIHPEQLDMILKWQSFRWGISTVRLYGVA